MKTRAIGQSIRVTLVTSLILLTSTVHGATLPGQAFIQTSEHGQALLMSRLNECYAVTPAHVIGGELFANLLGSSLSKPRGEADLLQVFGYDLSLLRVTGALAKECGTLIGNIAPLDDMLASVSAAQVVSVNPDGSISRRGVAITDVGLLYVRLSPSGEQNQLFKGLSGSLVLADKSPVGILMSVDPDTGEGRALRYDRAIETLRPFFGLSSPSTAQSKPPMSSGSTGNLASSVLSWSSPPLDGATRTGNLVDSSQETQWYAKPESYPIEIVLDLAGEKAQAIQTVRLVGDGVAPSERLPRDFELLVSSTDQGNWLSVSTGTYFMQDKHKDVQFAPLRARQVMLRIYSNWGDESAVGLSDITIPAAK